MSTEIIGLTIDNGGSGIRVLPLNRKSDVSVEDAMLVFSNEFYKIPDETFRVKSLTDNTALISILEAPNPEFRGYYAVGLTGRSYAGVRLPLDPGDVKSQSINFHRQFVFDIAQGIIKDERMSAVLAAEADDSTKGTYPTDWIAVVATDIPINEHSADKDYAGHLKESVAGEYSISYPLLPGCPVINVTLRKDLFGVLPEGGVVITSLGEQISEDETSLIIDIGHISTDMAVYFGKSLDGNSYCSSEEAGNTLISILNPILTDAGYRVNEDMVAYAIGTGKLKRPGGTYDDVTEYVKEAQLAFVKNYLHKELMQVFKRAKIVPESLDNIVVIGNPMNIVDGLYDMAELIIDDFGIDGVNIIRKAGNTRFSNIMATEVFTKILMRKAVKIFSADV